MSIALTDSMSVLCITLKDYLDNNKANFGVFDVYYGDQDRIPRTPSICVKPGTKERQLNGAPRRTEVKITVYVIVYHCQINNTEMIRNDDDLIADAVEEYIHANPFMKNRADTEQVISSLVTRIESGYQTKKNSLFRASILTVEMTSQVQLPTGV